MILSRVSITKVCVDVQAPRVANCDSDGDGDMWEDERAAAQS